jgi:hypothetical protein
MPDPELGGDDVRHAAASFAGLLVADAARDWSARAGGLMWSVSEVAAHVADVCGFYAVHLALRTPRRMRFDVALHPSASAADQANTIVGLAAHLAQVIDSAPPDARAWHHWGMSDTAGFAAMACDELLVHASDIAEGWSQPFEPDRGVCARILARLFPWAPSTADPWDGLRWANGRIALPGHLQLSDDWSWHSAPLTEWDGQRPTSAEAPDVYAWNPTTQRWQPDRPKGT